MADNRVKSQEQKSQTAAQAREAEVAQSAKDAATNQKQDKNKQSQASSSKDDQGPVVVAGENKSAQVSDAARANNEDKRGVEKAVDELRDLVKEIQDGLRKDFEKRQKAGAGSKITANETPEAYANRLAAANAPMTVHQGTVHNPTADVVNAQRDSALRGEDKNEDNKESDEK